MRRIMLCGIGWSLGLAGVAACGGSSEGSDVAPQVATFVASPSSVTSGVATTVTWIWTYSNTPGPLTGLNNRQHSVHTAEIRVGYKKRDVKGKGDSSRG
jgi:hypothetical protein